MVTAIAIAVAQDEMLRRMRDQQYELGGKVCSIEWVALTYEWTTEELSEVLALPSGSSVDIGDAVLVRVA